MAERRQNHLFRATVHACQDVLAPAGYALVERGQQGRACWVAFAPGEAPLTAAPEPAPRLRLTHDPAAASARPDDGWRLRHALRNDLTVAYGDMELLRSHGAFPVEMLPLARDALTALERAIGRLAAAG